ncbi:hypothetical protein [Burkholderia gladioli]|uniref:hypothetical protein n=1 Tax=Burkholderia gladioli TaxID=28095 RepID=UPI0016412997|nr:hypothetical protein [Burkholderia gladioli]
MSIKQKQNGEWAECTMPLAMLIQLMTAFAASLPTDKPTSAGQLWNDAGMLAIS